MTDFVAVRTENGLLGTVPRAHAEAFHMVIVDDEDAVDHRGEPLGQRDPNGDPADTGASLYEGRTVVQLRDMIDARNATRADDAQISKAGSAATLRAALEAADLTT